MITQIKTRNDAVTYLYQSGDADASFVCNVISGPRACANQAKRLKKLAQLHQQGVHIAFAQFAIFELRLDGRHVSWEAFDALTVPQLLFKCDMNTKVED